jgi:hypothetical protein
MKCVVIHSIPKFRFLIVLCGEYVREYKSSFTASTMRRPLLEKAKEVKQKVETVKAAVKVVQAVNEFRDVQNKQDNNNVDSRDGPIRTAVKVVHAVKNAQDRVENFQEKFETVKTVAKVAAVAVVAHTAYTHHMDKVNNNSPSIDNTKQSYSPPPSAPVLVHAVPVAQNVAVHIQSAKTSTSSASPTIDYSRFLTNNSTSFNEGGAREFMSQHNWPIGLQDTLVKGVSSFPLRFFIGDDSGSMGTKDGMLVSGEPGSHYRR